LIRILHIISGLSVGGAEMMLCKLLDGTSKQRFDPVVVSLTDRGSLGACIEALNIPVHAVGMRSGMPNPAAAWRLMRLVRQLGPELIQGWMSHGNLAALLAGAVAPGPVPVLWNVRQSIYSLDYERPTTVSAIKLCARLSRFPARILYNSKTSAIQHETLGYRADKTLAIPNGFDMESFAPSAQARNSLRSELGIAEDAILIGLVGSYHPLKDHPNFLRAASLLVKNHPNVHFVLSGRGVDQENRTLGELIHELRIAERVHLLGERHDMPRLTAALDIASSSSYSEGFSNTIGEAMACGVPCVVTDVGDSAWIVGETGRVVPPRDSEALCAAWAELVEIGAAARREIGAKARQRVKERFAIEKIVQQYEETYGELFSGA
jgi:glycosyltransferase involved in cell wall biosynthesis